MTIDGYLNSDKKKYYQTDFTQNVLTETHESWKLNDFIRPHLIELNQYKEIQPIFSKFPDKGQDESYLDIAYSSEIELLLKHNTIPSINSFFENKASIFSAFFLEPAENPLYKSGKNKFKMGCFNNPNYFKINHLRLTFCNQNTDRHEEFWNVILDQLKLLK